MTFYSDIFKKLTVFNGVATFLTLGNQGQRWIRGQYGIKASNGPYSVVFEGIRGSGYRGDIALDDLKLKPGLCSTMNSGKLMLHYALYPRVAIALIFPTSVRCLKCVHVILWLVFLSVTGNCNFEIDKCSWSDVHTDDFDWLSGSGATTSSSTGPRNDHTTGNATGKPLVFTH